MKKIGTIIYCVFAFFLSEKGIDLISLLFKASDPSLKSLSWNSTRFFLCLILALFWLGIYQILFKTEKLAQISKSIPSYLTAIGILGTFSGIFIGLYKFDVNNLQVSVPLLLDGLKLAFSTSIVGLSTSLLLKITHSITISIFQWEDPYISTREDPEIQKIIFAIEKNNSKLLKELKKLNNNFSLFNEIITPILDFIVSRHNQIVSDKFFFMSEKEFKDWLENVKKRTEELEKLKKIFEDLIKSKK